jgi:hypothetical protein
MMQQGDHFLNIIVSGCEKKLRMNEVYFQVLTFNQVVSQFYSFEYQAKGSNNKFSIPRNQ